METPVQIVAANCAHQLRSVLGPWAYVETRKTILDDCRTAIAHALTETRSGITRAEADLLRTYSRAGLTQDQVDRAIRYNAELIDSWHEVDKLKDIPAMLAWCETVTGERRAA